ncbi:aminotransferase class III-fold pyridoxal phosphate-dependent enzyme [Streptomyces sp. NPDC093094]|uniref:aminotransferase class III-fold pyridoxal phosphate-dependent enzyme n=1 Tax=Streptomyces sp. NPDC093094 TaxID=3366026 RepID=UPI00382A5495
MTVTEETSRGRTAREAGARTYAHALPIVPVRARGLTIEGADGRRYLDCLSGAGTLALGHNHPVVLAAIRRVLDSGAPLHVPDLSTPVEDDFVAELLRTLPPGLAEHARVRFCGPSPASAMEEARRLVRAVTGETEVLHLSPPAAPLVPPATSHGPRSIAEPAADAPRPAGEPGSGRAAGAGIGAQRSPGAAPGPQTETDLQLASLWPESARPAGVIVEAVRGDDRISPVPDSWTRQVRRLAATRSVPLIADETETGVGRTGAFWAVEHSGVTPDLMVLSKAIGGSLPLSLVVHHTDFEADTPARTLRGNQLAMAAGAATLAHVRENRLAERADTLGRRILGQLAEIAAKFPCVGEIRGRGLMIGITFLPPEQDVLPGGEPARPAAAELAAAVQRACLRRGLIVGLGGHDSPVVRLLPPLTVSDEQAAAVVDRLSDAMEEATYGRTTASAPFPAREQL